LLKTRTLYILPANPFRKEEVDGKELVDFKAVKSAVSMQMLLDRYQINWLRKSGGELRGRCPIHKGDGQDAFHVNVTKNVFNCFSCHARGNVLDFVAAMEKCSVRDAGLKLKEWFAITGEPATAAAEAKPPEPGKMDGVGESPVVINAALNFQLKGVDSSHAYLVERGISKETAERFGVGFFAGKGSMSGRVVIPITTKAGSWWRTPAAPSMEASRGISYRQVFTNPSSCSICIVR